MSENDKIISRLAVKIECTNSIPRGTGVIWPANDKIVYVLTAAHCLFEDGDNFKKPFEDVIVNFFSEDEDLYHAVSVKVDQKLIFKDPDKDVAVLLFDRLKITKLTGEFPLVFAARERHAHGDFIIKGFPKAAGGELDVLHPTWQQRMTGLHKFQLKPDKTYYASRIRGYSGSGVYIKSDGNFYLMGIFTRFREEEKGNVIYCQYLDTLNEILETNYLPSIAFSYVGRLGIHQEFFKSRLEIALDNLGPRFNEKLNLKLPIAKRFSDLAKDSNFRKQVYRVFDEWLTDKSHNILSGNEHIDAVEDRLQAFKSGVIQWFYKLDFSAETAFDVQWIRQEVASIEKEIHSKSRELIDLQSSIEKENKTEQNAARRENLPFENELNRLREISRSNTLFLRNIESKIFFSLVNKPYLLIMGAAGEGKSHALGDIANERLKLNRPALLLLGQHFNGHNTISENILGQLDLSCSFSEFLTVLNEIGKQVNSRVLFMIDALNESTRTELWRDSLSGFIREVSSYPYIALVFTIRSTYYQTTIPDNLKESDDSNINAKNPLTTMVHEGFRGKEYEALGLFCKYYDLKQPTFPIIAPEFTNPLFLQLVCIGVKNSGEKSFPTGFQGIKKVFEYYIDAVNKKLSLKEAYVNRPGLVKKALDIIAVTCYGNKNRVLTLEETTSLFDSHFEKFPNFLQELIQENVLIRNRRYNGAEFVDTIYFAFERLGDFITADYLLSKFETREEVLEAFSFSGENGSIFSNYYMQGIVEALAVILPERYNIEVFELRIGTQDPQHTQEVEGDDIWLYSSYFLKSLKWRSVENINISKIEKAFETGNLQVNDDDWFNTLMEFAATAEHPLNSDCFHELLSSCTMPERDSFWQEYLQNYGYFNSYATNSPIRRLIDWAWIPGISANIDHETARLTGQALAWLLASTYIGLRDKASKAMVNILQNRPAALLKILSAFETIDDIYIQERLFGVAYGCVLRDTSLIAAKEVSLYVFDRIFKDGNPPYDILLRDYARNICEYGNKNHPELGFDMNLVRPPYKSKMPLLPKKKDIQHFKIPYTDETDSNPDRYVLNRIYNSVIEDDFGNKVVNSTIREFCALPVNGENELKQFKKGLGKLQRKSVKEIQSCIEILAVRTKYRYQLSKVLAEKPEEEKERINDIIALELQKLSDGERHWMTEYGIPYLETIEAYKYDKYLMMSPSPIKYWIVKKAFDLGWDLDLHGKFDKETGNYNNRHNNRIERIGKKYQWIAFHEILGILSDNFKMEARSGRSKKEYFRGAWQLYLRDIDPAYITPNPLEDEENGKDDEDFELSDLTEKVWWEPPGYVHWNLPAKKWAYQIEDLPSVEEVLLRRDPEGTQWLHLRLYAEWSEPKALGEEKYWGKSKRLVYLIQGYFVKNRNKRSIVSYLADKSFWNRWMPEGGNFNRLINRENFWSPAYADEADVPVWSTIENTRFKVMIADIKAKGSIEDDKSGANQEYHMPCHALFEGLNLGYEDYDGRFALPDGSTAVISPNPSAPMVRRDLLDKFLKEQEMSIIWAVLGEKIADAGNDNYEFGVPCGVFTLEEGGIEGTLKMHERD